jgi:thioredoxin-like negative regulator of GroEL
LKTATVLGLIVVALIAASCAPAAAPPPNVTPTGDDRFLVDPRIGYASAIAPALETRFDAAWKFFLAGNDAEARLRLDDILKRDPGFVPAILAGAAIDIRAGRFDAARDALAVVRQRAPNYTAADVYEAEIAVRESRTRAAYDLYRVITTRTDAPPVLNERLAQLREALFNELYAAAQSAPESEAARLLREALALDAGAVEARVLLASKLVAQRSFEEARRELEPLLNTSADRTDVQALLAEIDFGRGRYQEALVRYERLARRTNDPQFLRRLEEIKQEWSLANMPAHYRTALESPAVTRAEMATLLYWTVPAVRFAQNLGVPPIAVDVQEVEGREEMIRAIAIGLFEVDPVTRRVGPHRAVTAARMSTHLARILQLRGAACARGVAAEQILAACGVTNPLATHAPDAGVPGRDAQRMLAQVAGNL